MSDLGDNDPTPPRGNRQRRMQSQTERDLEGIQARRERDARPLDQVAELAEAIDGVVEADIDGGDTPIQGFDGEIDVTRPVDMRELGPLTPRESELWQRIDRLKQLLYRAHRSMANRITAAIGARPPSERLAQLEARVKMLTAILAALGTLALGSIITTAKLLYEHGEAAGEIEQRAHALEQRADRDEERIDRLERELLMLRRVPVQERAATTPTRTP